MVILFHLQLESMLIRRPIGDRIRATKRSRKTPGSDPTALGEDGMLAAIEVPPLIPPAESKPDPTADIQQFFGNPYSPSAVRSSNFIASAKPAGE